MLSQVLFLLAVFFKQLYILPSGMFQLGDIFFAASFVVWFMDRRGKLDLCKDDLWFVLFAGGVFIVNFVHVLLDMRREYGITSYVLSTLYYVFNLLVILTFREHAHDRTFLKALRSVLCVSLLAQLMIWITGMGRWYDASRYMGTFNDPNQFAFYVFSSLLLIYVLSHICKGRVLVWAALAFVLIVRSASTGMLMGFFVMLLVMMFEKVFSANKKIAMGILCAFSFIGVIGILLLSGIVSIPDSLRHYAIVLRLVNKIESFGTSQSGTWTTLWALMEERCWDKLYYYPVNLLFGSGEGNFQRFATSIVRISSNEIHSSILGPLFYYGIIPFSFFMIWSKKQLSRIDPKLWCVYAAIIVESITLINNRQPFFWMLFVLAGSVWCKKDENFVVGV